MSGTDVPVITIDGPSGAGKGTIAMTLACELGLHLLDSGAVYRAAAVHALHQKIDLSSESAVVECVSNMNTRFEPANIDGVVVFLEGLNVTQEIRNETTATAASQIAVMPGVRQALLQVQREFAQVPGLVADGRDMGTVVFPDARLKVYLTASVAERAERRYKQLNQKGIKATMESLVETIEQRDLRDSSRSVSPLMPAENALIVDSTGISVSAVVERIRREFTSLQAGQSPA